MASHVYTGLFPVPYTNRLSDSSTGNPFEFLPGGAADALQATEFTQQLRRGYLANAPDLGQIRAQGPFGPSLPVFAQREPMCLIPDTLEQLQGRG
jgi:hypothetical protein